MTELGLQNVQKNTTFLWWNFSHFKGFHGLSSLLGIRLLEVSEIELCKPSIFQAFFFLSKDSWVLC